MEMKKEKLTSSFVTPARKGVDVENINPFSLKMNPEKLRFNKVKVHDQTVCLVFEQNLKNLFENPPEELSLSE